VPEVTDEIRTLIDDMFETMYVGGGVGLAAPQIGVGLRVITIDASPMDENTEPVALVNPAILDSWGEETEEEGCLCLPDLRMEVKRSYGVKVEGLDRDGNRVEFEAEGVLARVCQHEIDHLNGLLIIDRTSPVKRTLLRSALEKIKQEEP
jgi:peptide deformylase